MHLETASLGKAQTAVETFTSFIEQEKDFQICLRRLAEVSEAIHSSETRQSELATSLDKLQLKITKLASEIEQNKRESRDLERKYSKYQEASDAEIVEGNLAELEERLQALKEHLYRRNQLFRKTGK